jgi:hypothetical protein
MDIQYRLSKEDWAKRLMDSLAGMTMGNRQAHRSNQLSIQHLKFSI